ncbi:replication initiator protein A [Sphingopyxis sp.]|uniref:replication initiator protein A n=1 Tax=Sphingopyxis sp. TaxID=1908224 RepID=UPI00344B4B92
MAESHFQLARWLDPIDRRAYRAIQGMTLELSNWFWEGVLMKGGVLSIDRAYFDITGGRERWLYRVARKHAGGAGRGLRNFHAHSVWKERS